ncbi:DUF2254 domain-containing protein [Rhodococcus sp. AD45-ID]|uniref:DUF2254 domain-containing protein n=1 Tax=unclassified Rhodococcus (in: high G+C Gram-positive bacteria) TaxID=192944 RepID=UPI0005D35425|nr:MULTISPECIES: DUF2254 domain-containing protein [unclassified Rhodococcus (in: high G+C Gram-positive bacteria)]KJF23050.1 hypothetical protein SZ00_03705 [Rhodococcus sp. AD45]PSR40565.1 DUF2254 domain-containing protein [Rhodococcus sp. AD45-ID]
MKAWFEHTVVDTGRLPLFFLLVAFLLTFLFIRFSVRMIRAEVSWWPGNVTPGGMHIHHMVFGLMMMLVSGFAFIALADFHTPVANCVLASVFGIGSALVLDEYALVLHLRDVYWAEEGRSSIDAVFVAIAISFLFLFGVHPIGFAGEFDPYEEDRSIATLIAIVVALILQLALAMITLLKGKLWTGLIGLFFPPLLIVGAIRLSRPGAPWARSRYRDKPAKMSRAVAREQRVREPLIKAKIRFQESVSGSFGVPEPIPSAAAEPTTVSTPEPPATTPKWRLSDALRWRRTRRRLRTVPVWRLPVLLVVAAFFLADTLIDLDSSVFDGFGSDSLEYAVDPGATATLLSVIAGGMITLTGLVFTAITLAMQFGASQISVRVVPMLAQQRVMRWSIGMFLATFVYSIIVALDLALNTQHSAPQISTYTALFLAIISAILFIALVSRVGSILNSSRLLRWIAAEGRSAIVRSYPHYDESTLDATAAPVVANPALADDESADLLIVRLRHLSPNGRILLAINLPRLERLASKWGVSIAVVPGIGEFVAQNAPLFEVRGTSMAIRPDSLMSCLVFGDTHGPVVGPAAAIQSIVDIALKALSPAINDPGRAVQALDHIEDLLVLLAPRVHADSATSTLTRIRGQQRTWTDYVSIATDEIRHFSTNSAQVQRRLRAVFTTLLAACPVDQHAPLLERLDAMDAELTREWTGELDIRLAGVADPQGLGSEAGASGRVHPLIVGQPGAK